MHFIFPRLILISDKKNESWRQMMSHRALSTKFATRRNQAERITQKRLIEAMFREHFVSPHSPGPFPRY